MSAIDYAIKIDRGRMLDSGDPERAAHAPYEEITEHTLATDADGAFSEVPLGALDDDFVFVSASLAHSATLAANGTNYFTLSVVYYDETGAGPTTVANLATSTTGLTAKTTRLFDNVAGAGLLNSGGYLGLVGAAGGAGALLSASKLKVRLRRRS